MKNYIRCFFIIFSTLALTAQAKTIKGKITDGQQPLSDVLISNLTSNRTFISDSNGNYNAEAGVGDYLEFSFNGMKAVKIKIEDVTRILNVTLYPKANPLDEVVVEGQRKSQEYLQNEYVENENIIRTSFGYLDAQRSTYNVRILNLEENRYSYACIVELLRARFPELLVFGTCSSAEVNIYLRGRMSINNPQPILFDVDGQLLTQVPVSLPVGDMKRLGLFKDLASRARYGALGAGGIMAINTFNTSRKKSSIENPLDKVAQSSRLLSNSADVNTVPSYMHSIGNSSSMEEAKSAYHKFHKRYAGFPYFHLDTYTYFYENGDKDFADNIIKNNYSQVFEDNPVTLKALAYLYQEQLRYNKANEVLKQIFILRPNYAQSYLDVARGFRDLGNPKMSMTILARYDYLVEENFLERDSIGFDPLMDREVENLIALNKNELALGEKNIGISTPKKKSDTSRLVFEWNDSEAEFHLEFLQGNKEHYIWKHTYEGSSEEILREKKYGYSTAEYLVENATDHIPWQVNVKYFGNKSLSPTYLKVTKYSSYGSSSQSKAVKVFKLTTKEVNQQLLTL